MTIKKLSRKLKKINAPAKGLALVKRKHLYWGYDNNGYVTFGIASKDKVSLPSVETKKYLILNYNTDFQIYYKNKTRTKKMHTISLSSSDKNDLKAFIVLASLFKRKIKDLKFLELFLNLANLFLMSKSRALEIQGLFGELATVLYFHNNFKFSLVNYYQEKQKMPFDFSISETGKIEVKTTTLENREHIFNHKQLESEKYKILIVSIMLKKSNDGISVLDLLEECEKELKIKNKSFFDRIRQEISKWDTEELKNSKFLYDEEKISIFDSKEIDYNKQIIGKNSISSLSRYDLSNLKKMDKIKVKDWILTEIQKNIKH